MRFFYLLNIVMTIVVFALLSPSASAQQLPNGGVLAGEISVADEIDQFQFTGTAGEVVLIRVADTAGSGNGAFEPFVAVSDSSGDVLARGGSSTTGGSVAAIAIRLVADGQFTVVFPTMARSTVLIWGHTISILQKYPEFNQMPS